MLIRAVSVLEKNAERTSSRPRTLNSASSETSFKSVRYLRDKESLSVVQRSSGVSNPGPVSPIGGRA